MNTEAFDIFKYLPIRKDKVEDDYISHLWSVFSTLESANEIVQPFIIMPFHLLFMMALQYKALRISNELGSDYNLAFTLRNMRDHGKLCKPVSVFDFSLLQERTLPDLFRLVGVDDSLITRIKKLVEYRNDNLAHANGGIELKFNERVEEYLACLDKLQKKFETLNNVIATDLISELSEDDDKKDFIENRLYGSFLCSADFRKGLLNKTFGSIGTYI